MKYDSQYDSEIAKNAAAQTRQALDYLRDLIEDSDLTRGEIEDRAGFSGGYLSRLLNAQIDLKVRHLDVVLDALGVVPGQFFSDLYPRRRTPRRRTPQLKVSQDVVKVYGFGIESIRELRLRLERCEEVLERIAKSDAVKSRQSARSRP